MKNKIIKHIKFLEKITNELEESQKEKVEESMAIYGMIQAYRGEIEMLKIMLEGENESGK